MMTLDTIQKLGRDGMEATMRSMSALSSGAQAAATETADFAKRSVEHGTKATERLLGARSLEAVMQIQGEYLRASYEGVVAQGAKMGELATTVAKDAAAPLEGLFAKAAPTA